MPSPRTLHCIRDLLKSESSFLAPAVIERIGTNKLQNDSSLATEDSDKKPMVKLADEIPIIRRKKKAIRNEIDDIFGF